MRDNVVGCIDRRPQPRVWVWWGCPGRAGDEGRLRLVGHTTSIYLRVCMCCRGQLFRTGRTPLVGILECAVGHRRTGGDH